MRIEELHLKNFRCFKELDIQFPKSNLAVFIGLNGSGKSTILDAITLLIDNSPVLDNNGIKPIPDDILFGENISEFNICVNDSEKSNSWKISLDKDNCKIEKNESYQGALNTYIYIYYKTDRNNTFSIFEDEVGIVSLNKFDEWFEKQENLENELKRDTGDYNYTAPILNVVRKAIERFFSYISGADFKNLRVKGRDYGSFLVINKDGKPLKFSQLSSGQVLLLRLIGDISIKLAFQYKKFEKTIEDCESVLNDYGIVLIDEIELHLHPQWQREVLPALQKTFPNIQFIVTTHSPQVLSNLKKEEVFILENNKIVPITPHIEGRDSNSILYELFGVSERPEGYKKKLNQFYDAIDDDDINKAKEILATLTEIFGEQDIEIIKANLHLSFAEE